ncbi:MAG: hypothetical protein U9Q83_08575, partial [Bacteroidota bacterium]|nr:hypothetical protein [Bacteroidota bacterium]
NTNGKMTDKELEKILKQGENYTVEFKLSISKDIKNEICSFVNSSGGKFLSALMMIIQFVELKRITKFVHNYKLQFQQFHQDQT